MVFGGWWRVTRNETRRVRRKLGSLSGGGGVVVVRRRSIKRGRVFLPRRLSSIVFLATGGGGGGISCRPTTPPSPPVYGRNKREKYHRPFVSSRIVKVGQKLSVMNLPRTRGRGEEEQKIFGCGNCETGIAEGESRLKILLFTRSILGIKRKRGFSIFNRWIVRNSVEIFLSLERSEGKWLNDLSRPMILYKSANYFWRFNRFGGKNRCVKYLMK